MTAYNGVNYAKTQTVPPTKINNGDWGGTMKVRYDTYTATGAEAAGSTINIGRIAPGERVVGGKLVWSAMGTARTLQLGDAADADRYLAETSVAAAGSAAIDKIDGFGLLNGADPTDVVLTTGGGTLPADGVIKLVLQVASL